MIRYFSASISSLLLATSISAQAISIGSGDVTADISTSNGAINSFSAFGTDYFNHGTYVSNYGFMIDGNTSSFTAAGTSGGSSSNAGAISGASFSSTPGSISFSASYQGIFDFTRTYSVISGADNVIALNTRITNTGSDFARIFGFETFDPDQGITSGLGYGTFNDVIDTGLGFQGAVSTNSAGLNPFFIGSPDAIATAAGNPFSIITAAGLINLISSPVDGNGSFADQGSHIAIEYALNAGASATSTTYLATSAGDLSSVLSTLEKATEVPEPLSLALFGIGLCGLTISTRRKASKR